MTDNPRPVCAAPWLPLMCVMGANGPHGPGVLRTKRPTPSGFSNRAWSRGRLDKCRSTTVTVGDVLFMYPSHLTFMWPLGPCLMGEESKMLRAPPKGAHRAPGCRGATERRLRASEISWRQRVRVLRSAQPEPFRPLPPAGWTPGAGFVETVALRHPVREVLWEAARDFKRRL